MIDMHTHLDLYPDALKIIDKVNKINIFTLAVTTSPKAWLVTSKVFENYKNIYVSVGLHPEIVESKANEVDLLIDCIKNTNFVGEVGIDGSTRFSKSLLLQTRIFERVLQECEIQKGKIISIHSRGAESEVLTLLKKYKTRKKIKYGRRKRNVFFRTHWRIKSASHSFYYCDYYWSFNYWFQHQLDNGPYFF
jgi:TatD DNase family protein